jgi:subtilisin family serine protease
MAATKKRASAKKATPKKSSSSKPKMPELIYAQASPKSVGGVSMFEAHHQINSDTIENFVSEGSRTEAAIELLQRAGFQVLQVTDFTINIAGTRDTYELAFSTPLTVQSRPTIKNDGEEGLAEFIDSPRTDLPGLISTEGTAFAELLEGVAIEEKRYFQSPPPPFNPLLQPYWHLHPPGDLSAALNADRAHRGALTGRGVKVAMVDTGWYRHPYFTIRGYNAADAILGPGAASPLTDESGHGTGESANIFAVAPDVQFTPVKMSFTNSIGAFNAAIGLAPHIITCSWGGSKQFPPLTAADMALAAAIAAAVASGIVVVFSAGNGHFGFPGQHPDVISAGGAFMKPDETLQASDYASGFPSKIYAGRSVPDLCGLVGMLPRAIYIMLPVEPNDEIDRNNAAGGPFPKSDQTNPADGWAAFSGTSAAAPQLAGAAAILKQACPKLTPAEVREVLMKTARDVVGGTCSPSTGAFPATVGFDQATGAGLVDVQKAAVIAKLRCVPAVPPSPPVEPPAGTLDMVAAVQPLGLLDQPVAPSPSSRHRKRVHSITVMPSETTAAIPRICTFTPVGPSPAPPIVIAVPFNEAAPPPAEPVTPMSQQEREALENMIVQGDVDLE